MPKVSPMDEAAKEAEKEKLRNAPRASTIELKDDEAERGAQRLYRRKTQARFGKDDTSIFARIAWSSTFETMTMSVIVFNAFWIGIDTEWNHESLRDPETGELPLEPTSHAIENFFCIYFTIELTIRFFAFREFKICIQDAWFVFDSILVACMILETWVMAIIEAIVGGGGEGIGPLSALRLLRLLRLARMGRLMRFVPELGKLVKGMVKAFRSVIFILLFLVLIMYVFSIIFTGSFSDREKYPLTPYCSRQEELGQNLSDDCVEDGEFGELGRDLFATMGDSFMSLFTRGVLGDNLAETVQAILDESVVLMWVFWIFCIITFATLLNMLIGVICEVISDCAAEEEQQEKEKLLSSAIEEAFSEIDMNSDGLVSRQEWGYVKDNEKVRHTFLKIGLEEDRMEERLEQMQAQIFLEKDVDEEGEQMGLTMEQLVQKVVEMRPDADASALDLELMKSQVTKDQKLFKAKLKKMQTILRKYLVEQTGMSRKTQVGGQGNGNGGGR